MCGRYALTVTKAALIERFPGAAGEPAHAPRYNIAPSQRAPAVVTAPAGAAWAVPEWGLRSGGGTRVINARAESVGQRPLFRGLLEGGRCLVPANGFYEWTGSGGSRTPMLFTRRDRGPFAFAALWQPPAGPADPGAFVLLTTRPNETVRPVHDRMPVILSPDAERAWLDPDRPFAALRESIEIPFPADALEVRAVARAVNSTANEGPACWVEDAGPAQGLLW